MKLSLIAPVLLAAGFAAFAQDAVLQIADQTIFHDEDHPSSVTLPIVEDGQDD